MKKIKPLADDTPTYREVRGLTRGLLVLRALNERPGGIGSVADLARHTGLHRTTVKRLLETLRAEGFVRRAEKEGRYYLTFEVRSLSEGFVDDAWIGQVALPLMRAAVPDLLWPCDLGMMEAGFMVVRESTHRFSRLSQHRGMIGEQIPVFFTALGRAYLAACSASEREALLSLLARREDAVGAMARDTAAVDAMVQETLERGYATNEGEWARQAEFAAVAVPLRSGRRLMGAINLVYPRQAVSPQELQRRYLPRLRKLALRIGRDARPWLE